MKLGLWNRRAAVEGLGRILDAGGLEELFGGPDADAEFLYELLVETCRGRNSSYFWEISRTARRRGVTPEYVIDRAAVLLASMEERRRTDLYRILGSPALASGEALRQRWLEFVKTGHPDMGGDPRHFREVKEAYEILRDPARRAEYERFWMRALGPFERVAPPEEEVAATAHAAVPGRPPAEVVVTEPAPLPTLEAFHSKTAGAVLEAATRLFATRDLLDQRLGPGGLGALLARVEVVLAPLSRTNLEGLRADVDCSIPALETMRDELATMETMKRRLTA